MVVAEREEGRDAQAPGARRSIAHDDRLLALDEKDLLLDVRAADVPNPGGERVETKLDEVVIPRRVQRAWVLHRGKGDVGVAFDDLVEARQQHHAIDGRAQRRDQQAVVAPRIGARDRAHGKSARPVRLQPLETRRAREVGAHLP